MSATRLILASGSPRRRDLLASAGLTFDVVAADVDESIAPGEGAVDYVERVARSKADAVAARVDPALVVLAADTVVVLDGAILGKPADDADARHMLTRLSGRTHEVHTAVVVRAGVRALATRAVTDVTFVELDGWSIDWYLSTREHVDKAGAYGMQGAASAFVARIAGSPSNVIGLPLAETLGLLRDARSG